MAELVPGLEQSVAEAKQNLRAIGDGGLGNMWRLVNGDRKYFFWKSSVGPAAPKRSKATRRGLVRLD